jgi:hypothetical protein
MSDSVLDMTGSPPSHLHHRPYDYMETGLTMYYPSYPVYQPHPAQWEQAEIVLQDYIHFTQFIPKPKTNYKYLVGRVVYPNPHPVITDYMISYEEDHTGSYSWVRYVSTYYDKSPYPYDENVFFPAPLPIHCA